MRINLNVMGLLLVILVTLKAMGLTQISWFWVTSPLWIPMGFFLGFLALTGMACVIVGIIDVLLGKKKR